MRTNKEMADVLKAGPSEQLALFDELLLEMKDGEELTDSEAVIMEALKKMLIKKSEVVEMSAGLRGVGGVVV